MSDTITLAQGDADSVLLSLTTGTSNADQAPVDLTGLTAATLTAVASGATAFTLTLAAGLAVEGLPTLGRIRATFDETDTATAGRFNWFLVLEWGAAGPLTWPKAPLPLLEIIAKA